MNDIFCELCGIEIKDNDSAYGVTSGTIDEDSLGFRIDTDSDWDIYCSDCMNTIDKLIADYKRSQSS